MSLEKIKKLAPREMQVAIRIADGMSREQIAEEMKISVKTVDAHRKHMMAKLGIDAGSNRSVLLARMLWAAGISTPLAEMVP